MAISAVGMIFSKKYFQIISIFSVGIDNLSTILFSFIIKALSLFPEQAAVSI
jgi:hypothetical protein